MLHAFSTFQFFQTPATTEFWKFPLCFAFSRMQYNFSPILCSLFKMASFIQQYAFILNPCLLWLTTHFFLLLNNIPSCDAPQFAHLFTYWRTTHLFSIFRSCEQRSSKCWHSGFSMDITCQIICKKGVLLLDYMIKLYLTLYEANKLFQNCCTVLHLHK